MLLGAYGIYVSLPIDLNPQSKLERVDLAINLFIFIPSSLITVMSFLLAILCLIFPYRIDKKGTFSKFAFSLLSFFGFPESIRSEIMETGSVAWLKPLALLKLMFRKKEDS